MQEIGDIRKYTKLDILISRLTTVNSSLYQQSIQQALQDEKMKPKIRLEEIFNNVRDEDIRNKFQAGMRANQAPSHVPTNPSDKRQDKRLYTVNDNSEVASDPTSSDAINGFYDLEQQQESESAYISYMQKGQRTVTTYTDKPKEPINPCFDHFRGKCQAGNTCVYSHTEDSMQRHGEYLIRVAHESKFMGTKKIQDFLLKLDAEQRTDKYSSTLKLMTVTDSTESDEKE
jgi:hypothetical protein